MSSCNRIGQQSLAARGFGPEDAARIRPGIVYVTVSAYGHEGPWSTRRGFDSLVQSASGIAWTEARAAGQTKPRHLPCQALDHATGYLAAFGAMVALQSARDGRRKLARARVARADGPLAAVDGHARRTDSARRTVDFRRRPRRLADDGFALRQAHLHAAGGAHVGDAAALGAAAGADRHRRSALVMRLGFYGTCIVFGLFALPLSGAGLTFFAAAKKVSKESSFPTPILASAPLDRSLGVVQPGECR